MRTHFPIMVIILSAAICGAGCSKSTKPEPVDQTFYVDISPANMSAAVGDTLTFTGSINSVEGLFAISFDLVFDTTVVEFRSLSIPANSILGRNSISFFGEIDGGVGVSLGRTQTSGNDNVSASGVLFEVDFVVVGAGTSEIHYRDIYIIDENGAENPELGILEARWAGVEVL